MESVQHALFQFFGVILFLMALTSLYRMDYQLNKSIDYQIENIHKQKALEQL